MAKTLKKDLPPHYLVRMAGSFYDKEQSGVKSIKKYKVSIPIPLIVTANVPQKVWDEKKGVHLYIDEIKQVHINEVGIRAYLLKSKRLENIVRKQAVNFITLREYNIVEVVPSDPSIQLPTDPSALTLAQLKNHIKVNSWPIDLHLFPDLPTLREAVVNYMESGEGYVHYENVYRRRHAVVSAFNDEAQELDEYYTNQLPELEV